jgi:hypothetical protein
MSHTPVAASVQCRIPNVRSCMGAATIPHIIEAIYHPKAMRRRS